MKRFFITGTDTDCGKTYVTQQLVNYFPHSIALKPIASGCNNINGQLISADAEQLLVKNQDTNRRFNTSFINPWRFALPVSPHLAAEHVGQTISVNEVVRYCMEFNAPGVKQVFIEGAGGLMVPLNYQQTWLDFLLLSAVPVILVVGIKLGCINHALLTASVLHAHRIQCLGWIANCLDATMLLGEENIKTLTTLLKVPLLSVITYKGAVDYINLVFS